MVRVAELLAEPRAHQEPVPIVDGKVAPVVQGVDVATQQQPVIQPVLPSAETGRMCGLQDGPNVPSRPLFSMPTTGGVLSPATRSVRSSTAGRGTSSPCRGDGRPPSPGLLEWHLDEKFQR